MRNSNNLVSFVTSLCLLAIFGLACGGSGSDTSSNPTASTNNSPADTDNSAKPVQGKDIAGSYSVTGSNVDGAGTYTGGLTVTKRDDVYQFSWASGAKTYDGVGVQTGNIVAVAFTEGADGKGCGVVLYSIAANGDLDGKAGYWGINKAEIEKAKRIKGTTFEGIYEVEGTNTDGIAYTSPLVVTKDGDGYKFAWDAGNGTVGFGIRQGDTASIGIGGEQCGFVSYEVKPDGTLEGKWGGQSTKKFGIEVAKKR